MEAIFLEKVLSQNSFGYAYLDDAFHVAVHNKFFSRFALNAASPEAQPIMALFPETVGLEAILREIARGKRESFVLENINRERPDGLPHYFHIGLYHTGKRALPLFCLVQDVTPLAQLTQQIRQKENEILLLESLISAQSREVSVSLLGESAPIQRVRQMIEKIAHIPTATVLLQGESGTGKSMVARVIHYAAGGKNRPFVEINCAAIPEALLESELFGYEKGAFTHAVSGKPGLLEEAHRGTLFLDEIGDMSPNLQAKLLSFLETRRFRRLGGTKETEVNIRLITATNRDLHEMVEAGKFREDLWYRLNVVKIELPALRELGEDVLIIAGHFVKHFNREFRKSIRGFTGSAMTKMRNYTWPGNVRELRNAIERAMIFAESEHIEAEDLHLGRQTGKPAESPLDRFRLPPDGIPFEEIEKKLLLNALEISGGNQSKAAKILHLSRDAFRYRLEKHHLV